MKFDFKNILLGGLVMYVAMFAISMALGPLIHEGFLDPIYKANQAFWRPELNQDPPDLGSLMVRWVTVGLVVTFVHAGIYDNIRSALSGSGLVSGLKFGILVAIFYAGTGAGFSGIFNLPNELWLWWSLEGLFMYGIGGAALGWFIGKFGSD